ncbi:MAG: hypothetical protein Q9208_005502 [Pyrenodesmia sp. 3 TL-2023]
MSDAETRRLAHPEYWDDRYAEKAGPDQRVHEWLRSFDDLEPFLDRHLFQVRRPETAPKILHLGSGDSRAVNPTGSFVVETMSKRDAETEGIDWKQADVRQMDLIPSESVDVAFDKGTLDAMIHGSPWDPSEEVLDNTGRYIREKAFATGRSVNRKRIPNSGVGLNWVFRTLTKEKMGQG